MFLKVLKKYEHDGRCGIQDAVYKIYLSQLFVKFKIADQYLEVGVWKILVFCVVTPR